MQSKSEGLYHTVYKMWHLHSGRDRVAGQAAVANPSLDHAHTDYKHQYILVRAYI